VRTAYIGTSDIDQVFGVQFDKNGFPYVMGQTTGNWPVQNATYSNAGGKQFIAKLKPDLSGFIYSTKLARVHQHRIFLPSLSWSTVAKMFISRDGEDIFFNSNPFGSAGTGGLPVTPDAIKSVTDGKDMYFFVLKRDCCFAALRKFLW